MQAEIVAIGSELTSGAKLDTNSQWLSLQLAELGIRVGHHTTVADDLEANVEALRIATRRADLVLVTGGLGPTRDDLTRDALAALAGAPLVPDPDSLARIEAFFRARQRPMPERNRLQALFPRGAEPLPNPVGTAPGIWMALPRPGRADCRIAALPGVPSEMFKMFHEQVRPRLPGSGRFLRRARINCFGLGESATEELLGELTARGRDPEIGITAHEATITLRINAHGASLEECEQKIQDAAQLIRARLGDFVFGVEDEDLEHAVIRELTATGRRLSTLECATRGLLAQRLASVPGAADCFLGGQVLPAISDGLTNRAIRIAAETGADFVLCLGAETEATLPGGSVVSQVPLLLIGAGQRRETEIAWNGNPAIFRSYAMKCALKELWLMARKATQS